MLKKILAIAFVSVAFAPIDIAHATGKKKSTVSSNVTPITGRWLQAKPTFDSLPEVSLAQIYSYANNKKLIRLNQQTYAAYKAPALQGEVRHHGPTIGTRTAPQFKSRFAKAHSRFCLKFSLHDTEILEALMRADPEDIEQIRSLEVTGLFKGLTYTFGLIPRGSSNNPNHRMDLAQVYKVLSRFKNVTAFSADGEHLFDENIAIAIRGMPLRKLKLRSYTAPQPEHLADLIDAIKEYENLEELDLEFGHYLSATSKNRLLDAISNHPTLQLVRLKKFLGDPSMPQPNPLALP